MLHKLVYLVAEHGMPAIPKALKQYTPQYELLTSIGKDGLTSAALLKDISLTRLEELYQQGKDSMSKEGSGSQQDIRAILTKHMYQQVKDAGTMPLEEQLELYSIIAAFSKGKVSLVENDTGSFDDIKPDDHTITPSGFAPIDYLSGGFVPHTLMLIGASSGSGKTSMMLSIADDIAKQHSKRVVFVSLEMTRNAVANRAKHLALKDNTDNLIIAGSVSMNDIEEYADNNTIIIVDYADLLITKYGSDTRLDIATIYANLLRMSKRAFLLITATQLNRDATITLNSLSESSYKAFYSEAVYAISKGGMAIGDSTSNTVSFMCLKHRYAVSGNKCSYNYNYETLQVTSEPVSGEVLAYDMEI